MSYRFGTARVVGAYYFDGEVIAPGHLSGAVILDDVTAMGGLGVTSASDLSGSITLGDIIPSGSMAGEVSPIGRPQNDVIPGSWIPSAGPTLSEMLNEEVPNDLNYIKATGITPCKLALSPVDFPGTGIKVFRYRASSLTGNLLTVTLKDGATVIATWSHALSVKFKVYERPLTVDQINAIVSGALTVEMAVS